MGIAVTGFIFSFKHWGIERFDWLFGLENFFLTTLAAAIAYFGHIAPQKIYALSCGYQAEFKTWWLGLVIALVLCFISAGSLTLVLAGNVGLIFMVRLRLGQFRYCYRHEDQAVAGLWGILGSLIIAMIFQIFNLAFPENLFFEEGVIISLIYAICSVFPLPQLDGLNIFAGWKIYYTLAIIAVLISTLLLLFGGWPGLVIGITAGLIFGGITLLWRSEI